MRVLFVARRYWPAIGGAETFLRHLARALGQRHEVTVLAHRIDDGPSTRLTDSLRPPPTFEAFRDGSAAIEPLRVSIPRRVAMAPLVSQVLPGFRRYAYGRMRLGSAQLYARAVAPLIAREARHADVIHMWGGDMLATAVVRAARMARAPAVVTPFGHRNQFNDDIASGAAYRSADRVIGLLDEDAALYRDLGVPQKRLAVCGVCSPGVRLAHDRGLRDRHGITGPLVLFLGVRREYKGFDLLLQAAPRVSAARSDVTFAFVGPGPPLPQSAPGVRVIDVGPVDDEEREAWLVAADLLCLPSLGEIFPVSILEAWSAGTPALVSDIPTLRELISKSGGGLSCRRDAGAVADGILTAIENDERLRAMGTAGKQFWAAQHTIGAVADWHERLYTGLGDGGSTP